MKTTSTASVTADSDREWQKTQFSNLIRYVPSGNYFARIRVRGKLIRKSLKTDMLTTAKLRLGDLEKNEREAAESNESVFRGRMTFDDCATIFKTQTEASSLLKLSAKLYRTEILDSIIKSWPGIAKRDVRRFSSSECNTWAAQFSKLPKAPRKARGSRAASGKKPPAAQKKLQPLPPSMSSDSSQQRGPHITRIEDL